MASRLSLVALFCSLFALRAVSLPFAAVSTRTHFPCASSALSSCELASISEAELSTAVSHLAQPTSDLSLSLRNLFSEEAPSAPAVVLSLQFSDADSLSARDVASRLAKAFPGGSVTHGEYAPSSEMPMNKAGALDLTAVRALAVNGGARGVVNVHITADEFQGLLETARKIADSSENLAIVWSARHPGHGQAIPQSGGVTGDQKAKKIETKKAASKTNTTSVQGMQKPEISTAQLTGLLVGLLFLLIFLPGFMCLWNIQPPQTFEVVETSDARKKMQ